MQLALTPAEVQQRRNASRMGLWLYIVSMTMMFMGLTSAFLVKKSEKGWYPIELPSMFYVSTAVILLSSLTLHLALGAARRNQIPRLQVLIGATLALGVVFLFTQLLAFSQLVGANVFLVGPGVSGSFVYILSGLHGVHILAGLIVLSVLLIQALRLRLGAERQFGLHLAATFWHALDVLWVYLFLFLLANAG